MEESYKIDNSALISTGSLSSPDFGQRPIDLSAFKPELPPYFLVAKRAFDIIAASLALVVLFPVYLACAIAVRMESSGPVLFEQERVGMHMKTFKILKFRTMYEGSTEQPVKIWDEKTNTYRRPTADEDPRVTPIGKFLRRWSLDEIPQFFNILVGEMSLVGPRPLAKQESYEIPDEAFIRYTVPLGLTGLAQIRNRSIVVSPKRFELDLEYVDNLSYLNEFKIILATFTKIKQ